MQAARDLTEKPAVTHWDRFGKTPGYPVTRVSFCFGMDIAGN